MSVNSILVSYKFCLSLWLLFRFLLSYIRCFPLISFTSFKFISLLMKLLFYLISYRLTHVLHPYFILFQFKWDFKDFNRLAQGRYVWHVLQNFYLANQTRLVKQFITLGNKPGCLIRLRRTLAFIYIWFDQIPTHLYVDCYISSSLAGHLIECGAQVTGGIFTDWHTVPNWWDIPFYLL